MKTEKLRTTLSLVSFDLLINFLLATLKNTCVFHLAVLSHSRPKHTCTCTSIGSWRPKLFSLNICSRLLFAFIASIKPLINALFKALCRQSLKRRTHEGTTCSCHELTNRKSFVLLPHHELYPALRIAHVDCGIRVQN